MPPKTIVPKVIDPSTNNQVPDIITTHLSVSVRDRRLVSVWTFYFVVIKIQSLSLDPLSAIESFSLLRKDVENAPPNKVVEFTTYCEVNELLLPRRQRLCSSDQHGSLFHTTRSFRKTRRIDSPAGLRAIISGYATRYIE